MSLNVLALVLPQLPLAHRAGDRTFSLVSGDVSVPTLLEPGWEARTPRPQQRELQVTFQLPISVISPQLPVEIWENILSVLHREMNCSNRHNSEGLERFKTFAALCLVSKMHLQLAQSYLYSSFTFTVEKMDQPSFTSGSSWDAQVPIVRTADDLADLDYEFLSLAFGTSATHPREGRLWKSLMSTKLNLLVQNLTVLLGEELDSGYSGPEVREATGGPSWALSQLCRSLVQRLPQLEYLRLGFEHKEGLWYSEKCCHADILKMTRITQPGLRTLKLGLVNLFKIAPMIVFHQFISSHPYLESLDFTIFSGHVQPPAYEIGPMPNLKSLTIRMLLYRPAHGPECKQYVETFLRAATKIRRLEFDTWDSDELPSALTDLHDLDRFTCVEWVVHADTDMESDEILQNFKAGISKLPEKLKHLTTRLWFEGVKEAHRDEWQCYTFALDFLPKGLETLTLFNSSVEALVDLVTSKRYRHLHDLEAHFLLPPHGKLPPQQYWEPLTVACVGAGITLEIVKH
ncbi:hypothetical protein T439DRAFT_89459 [Meredithblackwellia eburnea MCA 4105]